MSTEQIDWGVPDWRDESAYPKPVQLTNTLWKWEFLRRDKVYRKDWLEYALTTPAYWAKQQTEIQELSKIDMKPVYKVLSESTGISLAIEGQHYPLEYYAHMDGSLEKYGLYSLPNPANPDPQHLSFAPFAGTLICHSENWENSYDINLPKGHVALIIDETKPLAPQLKEAEKLLKERQQLQQGRVKRNKTTKEWDYPALLRTLDAKSAGIAVQLIGQEVLKDNSNPEKSCADALKFGREMWQKINPYI